MDSRTSVHARQRLALLPADPCPPPAQGNQALARARGRSIALATRRLLALGHQRILLVSGPDNETSVAEACLSGHCRVMLAAQLPLLPRLQLETALQPRGSVLASLLEELAPTALLCTEPRLAARLQAAARAHPALAPLLVVGPDTWETAALPSTWH